MLTHLQPPDLLVEFPLPLLGGHGIGIHRLGEKLRQPLGHLLIPAVHPLGMDLSLGRNGVHRVDILERFQPDLGFQRGIMPLCWRRLLDMAYSSIFV
jgi:hypothetical protein